MTTIDFTTLADDGHVFHHSLDGTPLRGQPNATFAHRTDWFDLCSFCAEVVVMHKVQFGASDSAPSDEAPNSERVAA